MNLDLIKQMVLIQGKGHKVDNLKVDAKQKYLFEYLKEGNHIEQIEEFNEAYLNIFSPDVLKMITNNEMGWEKLVPDVVAEKIKTQQLFGYKPAEQFSMANAPLSNTFQCLKVIFYHSNSPLIGKLTK